MFGFGKGYSVRNIDLLGLLNICLADFPQAASRERLAFTSEATQQAVGNVCVAQIQGSQTDSGKPDRFKEASQAGSGKPGTFREARQIQGSQTFKKARQIHESQRGDLKAMLDSKTYTP